MTRSAAMRRNACANALPAAVRELIPVHADFNLDLYRLGADGMRSLLAQQLTPPDRGRFLSDDCKSGPQR
jgi:hypothetical protein